jgi:hypothetical protein
VPSIHDSLLTGYSVDGNEKSIVLHTEPRDGGGDAFIDILFRDVVAYHFEADCLQNIVFEINEVSADQIVADGTEFAERHRKCGWPSGWNPQTESAADFLTRNGRKVFLLHSSYGMEGWVAAMSIEERIIESRASAEPGAPRAGAETGAPN